MSNEPQNEEEYIRLVEQQAQQQENEKVPSHKELIDNYQNASRNFQEKECFYTLLLVLIVLAFAAMKIFPEKLGLATPA